MEVRDSDQRTILHDAAKLGQTEKIAAIVALSDGIAALNSRSLSGCTPLYEAVRQGHVSAVSALLDAAADCNIADGQGQTPLHWACQLGLIDTVKELIEHKADVNAQDAFGRTALHWICDRQDPEVVRLLLARGARVECRTSTGDTPLHWAARAGSVDICRVLLAEGANLSVVNDSGLSAADRATQPELRTFLQQSASQGDPIADPVLESTPSLATSVSAVGPAIPQMFPSSSTPSSSSFAFLKRSGDASIQKPAKKLTISFKRK